VPATQPSTEKGTGTLSVPFYNKWGQTRFIGKVDGVNREVDGIPTPASSRRCKVTNFAISVSKVDGFDMGVFDNLRKQGPSEFLKSVLTP
jgi:hypothetical protein